MKNKGFTLIELIVITAIITTLALIAIPGFSRWLPDYRLKGAARGLYSDMQLAKIGALRANADWAIVFEPAVSPGMYYICSDDGANNTWDGPAPVGDDTVEKTVDLSDYQSAVDYGHGAATDDILKSGSAPTDNITYGGDVLVFTSRGKCNDGYVYLDNNKHTTTCAVGTSTSGVIVLRKWNGTAWE